MEMALPLLEHTRINGAITSIEHRIETNLDNLTELQKQKLESLLNYVSRYWVRQITCEVLSVYRQIRRTNNDLESFHKVLHSKVGTAHANFWNFIDVLIAVDDSERRDFSRLTQGQPVRAPKKTKYLLQDRRIMEATDKLDQGRYSVSEFLSFASFHVPDFAATGLIGQRQENVAEDQGENHQVQVQQLPVQEIAEQPLMGNNEDHVRAEEEQSSDEEQPEPGQNVPVLDEPFQEGQHFGICPVCQYNRVNSIFEPCHHCSCVACGQELQRRHQNCYTCRMPITSIRRFYL